MLSNQKGFTLTELLLVMAVLAVMAAVVLPDEASLVREFKVHATVHDIQELKSALLRFHADMGVWPANNDDDPAPGLADVDLMGGSCGGSGTNENLNTNDPGLLCQGNSAGQVALGPSATTGTFVTINATTGTLRLWRGPYISKEIKSNQYGGSYVLSFENLPNVPGERFGGMPADAQDVVLKLTNMPGDAQLRIDRMLDDGNLSTGFIRGDGESVLKVVVAQF